MDPLRYVDLQIEVCRQLARKNDRYLDSLPSGARYQHIRDSAEVIREQDRNTFIQAERNVRGALDQEARFAGMTGERVTARPGDENYQRQEMVADRYRQLAEIKSQMKMPQGTSYSAPRIPSSETYVPKSTPYVSNSPPRTYNPPSVTQSSAPLTDKDVIKSVLLTGAVVFIVTLFFMAFIAFLKFMNSQG
jgi:hypothetical protein